MTYGIKIEILSPNKNLLLEDLNKLFDDTHLGIVCGNLNLTSFNDSSSVDNPNGKNTITVGRRV
jgi:hypothetical protein